MTWHFLGLSWNADLIASVIAIIVLLAISFFFSGGETALTVASRGRMHRLEQEGDARARVVNRMREHKERMIGAMLFGNNLANILASVLATNVLVQLFGAAGLIYATVAMTLLVLVFAEILPKTYALNFPDRVALFIARPAAAAVAVLAPVVRAVQAVVRLTLRVFRVNLRHRDQLVAALEELRGAIDLNVREGAMVKEDRDMLGSILDLDEIEVSEVTVHRRNMVTIGADLPPAEIVAQALAAGYTRLPLWRDDPDNIVGILHVKDLLRALHAAGGRNEQINIAAIMTPPWFVPETTTLREQLAAFRQHRAQLALVVDEYGALQGLVTLEDIVEEIVGEIRDEHDRTVSGVRAQPDGSYLVDGTVSIRDLNREFDWSLPDDVATTIAGLVIDAAQIIPEAGQSFVIEDFRFEVLRRKRNQITLIRIVPPASRSDAA